MGELLRRGDGFGSLGVGVPYFKSCYEFFRWWTWLLAGGLEPGDELLNGPDVPGEMPIPLAHNAIVQAFLRTDRDTLLIIEDDHSADQELVRRMRNKSENQAFDIVCASYPNRRDGHMMAVGCRLGEVNEYGEYSCVLEPMRVAESGTQEHDVAALGCVLIRRWVLEAMLAESGGDPEKCFWFDWRGRNSQDIQFYGWAHRLGARVGVDRDNAVVHHGSHGFTMAEFYAERERWREGQGQQSCTGE